MLNAPRPRAACAWFRLTLLADSGGKLGIDGVLAAPRRFTRPVTPSARPSIDALPALVKQLATHLAQDDARARGPWACWRACSA